MPLLLLQAQDRPRHCIAESAVSQQRDLRCIESWKHGGGDTRTIGPTKLFAISLHRGGNDLDELRALLVWRRRCARGASRPLWTSDRPPFAVDDGHRPRLASVSSRSC